MYLKFGKMPHEWREAPAPARYFCEQAWIERCQRLEEKADELNGDISR